MMRSLPAILIAAVLLSLAGCSADPEATFLEAIEPYDMALHEWAGSKDALNAALNEVENNRIRSSSFAKPGSYRVETVEIGAMTYDVKESDSIVSPYTGYAEWPVKFDYSYERSSTGERVTPPHDPPPITITLAYQDDKWIWKRIEAGNLMLDVLEKSSPPSWPRE